MAFPDDPVVRPAVWGTVAFIVVAFLGTSGGDVVAGFVIAFDLVLFALGCLAFVRTLLSAAERSRTEELSVGGIWFLAGSAPPAVQWWLLGCLAAQVVVAFTTAAMRPEPGAFGVLVPVFGLGLCGLWAVRSGTFPPRGARRTD